MQATLWRWLSIPPPPRDALPGRKQKSRAHFEPATNQRRYPFLSLIRRQVVCYNIIEAFFLGRLVFDSVEKGLEAVLSEAEYHGCEEG